MGAMVADMGGTMADRQAVDHRRRQDAIVESLKSKSDLAAGAKGAAHGVLSGVKVGDPELIAGRPTIRVISGYGFTLE